MKAYQAYDKQATADVERLCDGYAKANVLERVPYRAGSRAAKVIDQQSDAKLIAQMKGFDFHYGSGQRHRGEARQGRLLPEAVRSCIEGGRGSEVEAGIQINLDSLVLVALATSFPAGIGGFWRDSLQRWPQHKRAVE